jgi:hypothetical protein
MIFKASGLARVWSHYQVLVIRINIQVTLTIPRPLHVIVYFAIGITHQHILTLELGVVK